MNFNDANMEILLLLRIETTEREGGDKKKPFLRVAKEAGKSSSDESANVCPHTSNTKCMSLSDLPFVSLSDDFFVSSRDESPRKSCDKLLWPMFLRRFFYLSEHIIRILIHWGFLRAVLIEFTKHLTLGRLLFRCWRKRSNSWPWGWKGRSNPLPRLVFIRFNLSPRSFKHN